MAAGTWRTAHCAKHRSGEDVDARAELLSFLDASDDAEEPVLSSEVRIVLELADFGREITTTVLWLNNFEGMDMRCVRLVPHEIDGRVLLDIQQVLPLPEAADFQVRLRPKEAARDRARTDGRDFTRYHIVVEGMDLPDQNKRNAPTRARCGFCRAVLRKRNRWRRFGDVRPQGRGPTMVHGPRPGR